MDLSAPSSTRKRLKISPLLPKTAAQHSPPNTKWRSPAQERLYRRRLLNALRPSPGGQAPRDPRSIKDAADSALALTAGGSSRWSRAILSRRWRVNKMTLRAAGKVRRKRPPHPPGKKPEVGKVGERLRRLARLVPGCRQAPTGSLLEETADYVAALEVQVRAMRALADALATAAISSRGHDVAGV